MSIASVERIAETRNLATRISTEADTLARKAARHRVTYAVIGVFSAFYLAWAFNRLAHVAEPGALATSAADISAGHMLSIIAEEKADLPREAPAIVRQVEATAVAEIPHIRRDFQASLENSLRDAATSSIESADDAMIAQLGTLPDAAALVKAAAANPVKAADIIAKVRRQLDKQPDVKQELERGTRQLVEMHTRLHRLRVNQGLSPAERAERRLIQLVVAKLDLPEPDPIAGPVRKHR